MIKIGKFYINIFVLPLFVVSFVTNSLQELVIAYLTVTLHELAHLFVAIYYKVGIGGFVIMPFGVSIRLRDNQIDNPMHECAICAAGPVANFFLILIFFIFRTRININDAIIDYFICSNAAILLINAVPIVPLDGGRVLRAALTSRYGFARATKTSDIISQINILIIGLFGIWVLYVTHFNVSIMLLCAFLIFNMSAERKNNELTLMRQLVHSKQKLAKRKIMPVRELAVMDDTLVRKLLKNFSYDSYYIVNVMDNKMRIKKSFTETQIIEALKYDYKNSTINNLFDKFSQSIVK